MSDNGFGAQDNSGDFEPHVYRVAPDFETARSGGDGSVEVDSFIRLRDPWRRIRFETPERGASAPAADGS